MERRPDPPDEGEPDPQDPGTEEPQDPDTESDLVTEEIGDAFR